MSGLMPYSFCLIRHGETTANRDHIVAGVTDVVLTDLGRAQARLLTSLIWPKAMALKLFSSPMTRAKETAEYGFPGHENTPVKGLEERNWGIFEGTSVDCIPDRSLTPPDGESWHGMIDRVEQALKECFTITGRKAYPIIIAHSGVIRAARLLTGQDRVGQRPNNAAPHHFIFTPTGYKELDHDTFLAQDQTTILRDF